VKKKLLIVTALLAAAAVVAGIWTRRQSDWEFVCRVTGFNFPAGTEYLAQHDNAEWYIVSVVRLPESFIPEFIREHRLTTGKRVDLHTAFSLPEKYRAVPDRSDVLSASAQKEYQAWQAILDPRSRLLWIQVTYPDFAGDHPGTAPQPTHQPRP
jgi:hypothetical protein